MCLRPSVLRCWRALPLCVLPFCNLFPRTYVRPRLIPYYDSDPLHKHQIYIRPIFHLSHTTAISTIVVVQLNAVTTGAELETHQMDFSNCIRFQYEPAYHSGSKYTVHLNMLSISEWTLNIPHFNLSSFRILSTVWDTYCILFASFFYCVHLRSLFIRAKRVSN